MTNSCQRKYLETITCETSSAEIIFLTAVSYHTWWPSGTRVTFHLNPFVCFLWSLSPDTSTARSNWQKLTVLVNSRTMMILRRKLHEFMTWLKPRLSGFKELITATAHMTTLPNPPKRNRLIRLHPSATKNSVAIKAVSDFWYLQHDLGVKFLSPAQDSMPVKQKRMN